MKLKTVFKILIISSIVLPALIVGIIGSAGYESFYGEMVANETASVSYSAAKSQTIIFDRYSTDLATMGQMDIIKRAAGGDYNAIKDKVDELLVSRVQSDSTLKDLIIMDSNGYSVAAAEQSSLSQTYKDFDKLSAVSENSFYISDISFDNAKYEGTASYIYIIREITTATGGKGYIGAVIDTMPLCVSLNSTSFFNTKGVITFMDASGNALNVNGNVVRSSDWEIPANITADSLASIGENNRYAAFDQNGYYGAYGRISDSEWLWIAYYPASAASFDVIPVLIIGLIVFAVFIVIDSIIAFAIYRRAITPIGMVTSAMEEINAGDRQKRLPNFKAYEFQVISEAFNSLLDEFYVSEDVHRTIASLSESMLFEWDLNEKSLFVSQNFKDTFALDYERANIFDNSFLASLMSEVDARHFVKDMNALNEGLREYVENEFLVKTKNNTEIWVNIKTSAVSNRSGSVIKIMGMVTDINNKKKSSLQLSQKASYDFLSQLYNRSTFLKELQKILDLKRANEKYAILFIDVDDFKFINDRYGHNVGDEVIKYVSDTIKECVGKDGIAGRFGGDEFVLCVTGKDKVENCDDFSMSIIDALYSGYNCETAKVILNVNASIGIALAPEHGTNAEKLVGAADEAMYFVKKNGKSNYHIYDPSSAPDLDMGNTII
ncbi:MAG: diguanylate cyclase [Ruminococcaceae bacterium]|nr:diguanylate cyclase [Oscillospiraceae bacterium]